VDKHAIEPGQNECQDFQAWRVPRVIDMRFPNVQVTNTALPDPRRHDLDALRASAMLLGILYHAALSFALGFTWSVQDVSQTKGLFVFQA
jgi:hypothetical protein